MKKSEKIINDPKRFEFGEKIKQLVRDKAGGLCSYENCLSPVKSGDSNSGDVAHIFDATSSVNIRGQGSHAEDQIKSVENGILLCKFHHPISDSRSKPIPPEKMLNWKSVRELAHKLSIEDEDIRRSQPHIGNYFIDSIVRQELEKNLASDGLYDVDKFDANNIREACKVQYLIIEFSRRSNSYCQNPIPPSDFRLSKISEIYKQSEVVNKKYDAPHPAGYPSTDFSLMCDLIEKWNALPNFQHALRGGYKGVISSGNVGLVSRRKVLLGKFDDVVIVNNDIYFSFNPKSQNNFSIFKIECWNSLINWKVSIFNEENGFYEKKEIQPLFKKECLPISLQWGFEYQKFDIIKKWDKLLQELDSGDELVAVFSAGKDGFGDCWFHENFNPHAFQIAIPNFPSDTIKKLRKIVNRALLVEQLWLSTINWKREAKERFMRWIYTDDCFDSSINETELINAMKHLEYLLTTLQSCFFDIKLSISEKKSHQLVLRYKNGDVFVTRAFRY